MVSWYFTYLIWYFLSIVGKVNNFKKKKKCCFIVDRIFRPYVIYLSIYWEYQNLILKKKKKKKALK